LAGVSPERKEAVVLSPHFDDAVLSCWHVLAGPCEVRVLTVFGGAPPNGQLGYWDRLTGARDGAERVRERAQEDRKALALAGRTSKSLPILDEQHRDERLAPAELAGRLRGEIPEGATLFAPAALGLHPDHRLLRDAGLDLRAQGHPVVLYADLPHAVLYGWPAWVTGSHPDPFLDVGVMWEDALATTGLPWEELHPEPHRLDDEARALKAQAVRSYRTQLSALSNWGRLEDPDVLGYEVLWPLP
jgi:LmbE family N-acetylglucosaminyl deacetylase